MRARIEHRGPRRGVGRVLALLGVLAGASACGSDSASATQGGGSTTAEPGTATAPGTASGGAASGTSSDAAAASGTSATDASSSTATGSAASDPSDPSTAGPVDMGGGTSADPAVACAGTSPYDDRRCGAAIRAWCLAIDNEADCFGRPVPVGRPDGFTEFLCTWVRVVEYDDPSTCQPLRETFRCEGSTIPGDVGCYGSCPASGVFSLYDSPRAWPETGELLAFPCTPDARPMDGPIGEWTERGFRDPQDDATIPAPCSLAQSPPPSPLCNCAEAFCAPP